MSKEIVLRCNKDGVWERYEPYATIECPTEDDYNFLVNAVEKSRKCEGTWEKSDIPGEKYVCSECGGACWYYDFEGDVAKSKFCPNCGAKMKGV